MAGRRTGVLQLCIAAASRNGAERVVCRLHSKIFVGGAAGAAISIPVQNYTQSDYTPMVGETAGKQALLTKEEGYVEWEFDVPQDGLYTIQVDYFPTSGKSSSIIRTVYIDGELPFEQMRSVVFDRVWVDKKDADGNTIRVTPNGNEIRPEQIEAARWQTTYLKDSIGYYPEPFQFYFTQGKHTLRFEAVREPMEIGASYYVR